MRPGRDQCTRLLIRASEGNTDALKQLFSVVYQDLRHIASKYMRGERPGHTLHTTALVHEAYLRLINQKQVKWQNRAQFFAIAAQAMRRILVDYARQHCAAKRGKGMPKVSLTEANAFTRGSAEEVLQLDEALQRLQAFDERQSKIVELRFFSGLTIEETANVLAISPATVKREWNMARAWLYKEISQ